MIIDCHTHRQDAEATAIINAPSAHFKPHNGRSYCAGIHPWYIHRETLTDDLSTLEQLAASSPQVVAIGETGLDSLCATPPDIQLQVFTRHIVLSEALEKPLIIHCVRRSTEIIALHRKLNPSMPWIIHGFRSNANVMHSLLVQGIYISLGERFNADVAAAIPLDRLLIETDESALPITDIAAHIALARGIPAQNLMEAVTATSARIFGSSHGE